MRTVFRLLLILPWGEGTIDNSASERLLLVKALSLDPRTSTTAFIRVILEEFYSIPSKLVWYGIIL